MEDNSVNVINVSSSNGAPGMEALPAETLQSKADRWGLKVTDKEFAHKMDEEDSLGHFREKFFYPKKKTLPDIDLSLVNGEDECIYLATNSLGLQPRDLGAYVQHFFDDWAHMGVEQYCKATPPVVICDELARGDISRIVGAKADEVAIMNSLSVNLHLLMVSFYRPTEERHKILVESHIFTSDLFAAESQIRQRGFDPSRSLLKLKPRQGGYVYYTEDILETLRQDGSTVALLLLPGVQYHTGQFFDIKAITEEAHKQGCYILWDLSHAVGNVELFLHDWDVDCAAWCHNKYLNAGAGSVAGAFIHDRHAHNDFPKFLGWWGATIDRRTEMDQVLDLSSGVAGYRISTPPALLVACLQGSLATFNPLQWAIFVLNQYC